MSLYQNRIVRYGDAQIDAILFNPENWRIHPLDQQKALEEILGDVGIVQTLLINLRSDSMGWSIKEQGEILLDGHLRVIKAAKNGLKTWPAIYVDLTKTEEAAVLASLDAISRGAGTDKDKLLALTNKVVKEKPQLQDLMVYILKQESKGKRPPTEKDGSEDPGMDQGNFHRCPKCSYEWRDP